MSGLNRAKESWAFMSPKAVCDGSSAQILFCVEDARHDILYTHECLAWYRIELYRLIRELRTEGDVPPNLLSKMEDLESRMSRVAP